MLYVFYGNDVVAVRERAHRLLDAQEKKGVLIEQIVPEEYELGMLADRAGATSLFSEERIVLVDTPSEKKEVFEDVMEHSELLGASANTFVLIEGQLRAPEQKALAKHAKEMHEAKEAKQQSFNIFAITDALLRRDKKALWVLLERARAHGISGEEIVGVLFWQIKMLILAERTASATEAGVKPFVYSKAKGGLAKLKGTSHHALSRELLTIYHDAHSGKRDIDIALERFVLGL